MKWLAPAAIVWFAAASGRAQSNAPAGQSVATPTLREIAETKSAEWEMLARGLDRKIARLLPCDPGVKAAIDEVSRASAARLATLDAALRAASDRAKAESEQVRAAIAAEDIRLRDADVERVDSEQERAAVEGELADLTETAKHRVDFEESRKKLAGILELVGQRASDSAEAVKFAPLFNVALRELLVASQAREVALAKEEAALSAEASHWSEYYAARIARAQTECSITNPVGAKKKRK